MKTRYLVALYPRAWRLRYGDELEELVGDQRLSFAIAFDLIRGAVDAHLHPEIFGSSMQTAGGAQLRGPTLRRPSALIPIVMSAAALAVVLSYIAMHGPARQPDEGTATHLWQLLMAGQVPVIAWFAVRWLRTAPLRTTRCPAAVPRGIDGRRPRISPQALTRR